MRKFYFLFFVTLAYFGTAQIVNIPDTNFKAKLIATSPNNPIARNSTGAFTTIDVNNDGEIQESEALGIRELIVNSASISDLTGIEYFKNLHLLFCSDNQLSTLDLSGLTRLIHLNCNSNNLQTLDLSGTWVNYFNFSNNIPLTSINFKNGIISTGPPMPPGIETSANYARAFSDLPNLMFICTDEAEIAAFTSRAESYNYSCEINTYCTFVPGGIFYTINGTVRSDSNNNGCDNLDEGLPFLKFALESGQVNSTFVANASSEFSIPLQAGTHSIVPIIENPDYFTVSPSNVTVSFPSSESPFNQNFCISPNGSHPDIETFIIPLTTARPGFNSTYQIMYRNKGSVPISGTLYFGFPDDRTDFISSSVTPGLITNGVLAYIFNDLQLFESRTILVTLHINSPTDSPPVNAGDFLNLSIHAPLSSDEMPEDNFFAFPQIVVNSFDPNDKTCLEGTTITPEMVGNYVHYMIRFENTGTANAENVVVKDMIDTSKFDVTSLIPLDGSHIFTTRISDTNKVEFIFENIQLPFDDANNDGYVTFKIKTKPTLVLGNTFSNSASIYFDYNHPIVTDPAVTTVALPLKNNDFDFGNYFMLYPNPVSSSLNIFSKQDIEVRSMSVYNTIGQLLMVIPNANFIKTIDVSHLSSGNYLLKISSDKGSSTSKFIKK